MKNRAPIILVTRIYPHPRNNSAQENNLQFWLDLFEPTLHKEITCAVLAHMADRQC